MPPLMHFYPGLSPSGFWALRVSEMEALSAWRAAYLEAQRRG